jgi:long-chain acyl-CoA synthetase
VSPFVREAVVIGDGRPYLSALIGIEPETVGAWAFARDLIYTTFENLVATTDVQTLVADVVAAVNEDLAPGEGITAFRLLPKELDEEADEVTPTQRIKRPSVAREFHELIESMYVGPPS